MRLFFCADETSNVTFLSSMNLVVLNANPKRQTKIITILVLLNVQIERALNGLHTTMNLKLKIKYEYTDCR